MANISATLKNLLKTGVRATTKAARAGAKATKFKMDEVGKLSKRKELLNELGTTIFSLAQNGFALPAEADTVVKQIEVLDRELALLRAEYAAQKAAAAEAYAAEKAVRAAEKSAAAQDDRICSDDEQHIAEADDAAEKAVPDDVVL